MMRRPVFALMAVMALLQGCETTKHAKDVQPSGFLAPYRALLTPGQENEALLRYRSPKADWAAYHKILLEPIAIWDDPTHRRTPEEREDLQRLADSFYDMLYLKLAKDYEMVEKPGPGAMRVQTAISHGEESIASLTFVSKAIPQARMLSKLWSFGSGKPAFTGEVTLEAVVKDAQTGELLAAGADRRVGGMDLFDKEAFNSWGDVKNSLAFWSDASVYRLCRLRGGTNCVKPDA